MPKKSKKMSSFQDSYHVIYFDRWLKPPALRLNPFRIAETHPRSPQRGGIQYQGNALGPNVNNFGESSSRGSDICVKRF